MYTIKHTVANGGYKKGANLDPDYPNVADLQSLLYFNLIEFVGHSTGSGDLFRWSFIKLTEAWIMVAMLSILFSQVQLLMIRFRLFGS